MSFLTLILEYRYLYRLSKMSQSLEKNPATLRRLIFQPPSFSDIFSTAISSAWDFYLPPHMEKNLLAQVFFSLRFSLFAARPTTPSPAHFFFTAAALLPDARSSFLLLYRAPLARIPVPTRELPCTSPP
jgi:hypothetical protein